MQVYEPLGGETIHETARIMVELCQKNRMDVKAKFNDLELLATSTTTADQIVETYQTTSQQKHEEWMNSPAGEQSRREAEEKLRAWMSEPVRKFHIGDILTITSGRLLSPKGVSGLYEILKFMTGDNIFTHHIPHAMDICRPYLVSQFPEFVGDDMQNELKKLAVVYPDYKKEDVEKKINEWLTEIAYRYGEYHPVEHLKGEYEPLDLTTF